jgi:four helix bundle protein
VAVAVEAAKFARCFRGPGASQRADQLVRATLSVPSNIAEACGRGTLGEFRQFLLYARGSAQEALSHLAVARALEPQHQATIRRLESRCVLIIKSMRRLMNNPPKQQ